MKYLKLAALLGLLGVPELPRILGVIPSMGIRRSRPRLRVEPDR